MEYSDYEEFIHSIVKDGDFRNFKSNPVYTNILEHVSSEYGKQYLYLIRVMFSIPDELIKEFGYMNDLHGMPTKVVYDGNICISPTSLRYIFHSLLILRNMKSHRLTTVNIVEVGCGYGGLALAIYYFSKLVGIKVTSYHMIDLDAPSSLQKKYLELFNVDINVSYHSASTYGKDVIGDNYFLISNYCFSEITSHHQEQYVKTLFPKCSHGFLTWNHIDVYDFGKSMYVENEYPLTGLNNKYIVF
jgi:hypothetical protein